MPTPAPAPIATRSYARQSVDGAGSPHRSAFHKPLPPKARPLRWAGENGDPTLAPFLSEEALEILTVKQHAAVIVDLRLTGISGDMKIPFAHRLQPNLHFLIHTGSADYRLSKELLQLGMTSVNIMLKPLSDMMILINFMENRLGKT